MKALIRSIPCGARFLTSIGEALQTCNPHPSLQGSRPLVSTRVVTPPSPLTLPSTSSLLLSPAAWASPPPQPSPFAAARFTHVRVALAGGSEVRGAELRAPARGGRGDQLSPSRDWLERRRRVRGAGGFPARAKMAASRARL